MRLSIKEAAELADLIEDSGGDASSLRDAISDITGKPAGAQAIAVNEESNEEHIEALRKQSTIEHGEELECMVCHAKVHSLVSGTCENCFREWVLTIKRR